MRKKAKDFGRKARQELERKNREDRAALRKIAQGKKRRRERRNTRAVWDPRTKTLVSPDARLVTVKESKAATATKESDADASAKERAEESQRRLAPLLRKLAWCEDRQRRRDRGEEVPHEEYVDEEASSEAYLPPEVIGETQEQRMVRYRPMLERLASGAATTQAISDRMQATAQEQSAAAIAEAAPAPCEAGDHDGDGHDAEKQHVNVTDSFASRTPSPADAAPDGDTRVEDTVQEQDAPPRGDEERSAGDEVWDEEQRKLVPGTSFDPAAPVDVSEVEEVTTSAPEMRDGEVVDPLTGMTLSEFLRSSWKRGGGLSDDSDSGTLV